MANLNSIDELIQLEDELDVTTNGTLDSENSRYFNLLSWIDRNKGNIPLQELEQRELVSADNPSLSLFNLFSNNVELSTNAFFKSGNLVENEQRDVLINTWVSAVSSKAKNLNLKKFNPENLSTEYVRSLLAQSIEPASVTTLKDRLSEIGIIFIVEKSFPGLGIDGVVFRNSSGTPVIGHSLRYDRLDNFWYTLLHELSHIVLHYDQLDQIIIEDLDSTDINQIEAEANYLATNFIVPKHIWRRCDFKKNPTLPNLNKLADELNIHPALIAGKFRFETNQFVSFSELVNQSTIREFF